MCASCCVPVNSRHPSSAGRRSRKSLLRDYAGTTLIDQTGRVTERKETVAQRVERIKREKPSWSIMDDIKRYAKEGFDAIDKEDLSVRFRAWGLYTQGDGWGTRGEEMPFFMMRVRTPNGVLTSEMVRTIANLSDR